MSDLSKFDIAKHIGMAEQTVGNIDSKGCVPITVAFTHGFDSNAFRQGLRPSTTIDEVKNALEFITSKNDQVVVADEFLLSGENLNLDQRLSITLSDAKTAWIVYYTENRGHMIGLLKNGEDIYTMCDASKTDKYTRVSFQEVVEHIQKNHKQNDQMVYVFGFVDRLSE